MCVKHASTKPDITQLQNDKQNVIFSDLENSISDFIIILQVARKVISSEHVEHETTL